MEELDWYNWPERVKAVKLYRLPSAQRVLAVAVEPYSPAERSGVMPGDVIVALDGRPIKTIAYISCSLRTG